MFTFTYFQINIIILLIRYNSLLITIFYLIFIKTSIPECIYNQVLYIIYYTNDFYRLVNKLRVRVCKLPLLKLVLFQPNYIGIIIIFYTLKI